MKSTRHSQIWVVVLFAAVACSRSTRVATVERPHILRTVVVKPNVDATVAREVYSARVTYVFRASRGANFIYALDCASALTTCSREAYESAFAPLDAADQAALRSWKEIHTRYSGDIVMEEQGGASPLPIYSPITRSVSAHIRLAAYGADDVEGALDRMNIFLAPTDGARARRIIERFAERFERLWLARRDELARKVDAFASLVARPDVMAIIESVANFYAPDLPEGTRETIEIVARPEQEGSDYGEQLGDHALVETRPDERAEARLDVVLHELFHRWFASAPEDKKRMLAAVFATSSNPAARPAYGLLNESLATAFGNGLIQRAVNRKEFDRRMGYALGLYHDRFVDPTVKAILPWLDAYVAAGKTLYDPEFVDAYVGLVSSTFAKGLAPVLHLRPMVSAYDAALEAVEQHFYGAISAGWIESESSFEQPGRELLAKHPTWGTTIVVLSAHIDQIRTVEKSITPQLMTALRKEAMSSTPFVLTVPRANAEPLFVFVAPTAPAMQDLMDRFVALDATTLGVWR